MPLIQALGRQRQANLCEFKVKFGPNSKFQDSQNYTERPCLKNKRSHCCEGAKMRARHRFSALC